MSDFKTNAYEIAKQNLGTDTNGVFEKIYEAQDLLLRKIYKFSETQPLALDLESKSGQNEFRSLAGYFTEELCECFEQFLKMAHKFMNVNDVSKETQQEQVEPDFLAYNEEISDCIHFAFNLLIYSGITGEDIKTFIIEYSESNDLEMAVGDDLMKSLVNLSMAMITADRLILNVISDESTGWNLMKPDNIGYITGGSKFTDASIYGVALLQHKTIYHLGLARNTLKLKPWKKTEIGYINYPAFRNEVIFSFISFITFLVKNSMTPADILVNYSAKNRINHERIENKY